MWQQQSGAEERKGCLQQLIGCGGDRMGRIESKVLGGTTSGNGDNLTMGPLCSGRWFVHVTLQVVTFLSRPKNRWKHTRRPRHSHTLLPARPLPWAFTNKAQREKTKLCILKLQNSTFYLSFIVFWPHGFRIYSNGGALQKRTNTAQKPVYRDLWHRWEILVTYSSFCFSCFLIHCPEKSFEFPSENVNTRWFTLSSASFGVFNKRDR